MIQRVFSVIKLLGVIVNRLSSPEHLDMVGTWRNAKFGCNYDEDLDAPYWIGENQMPGYVQGHQDWTRRSSSEGPSKG